MSSRWYSDYKEIKDKLKKYEDEIIPDLMNTRRKLKEAELQLSYNMPYLKKLQTENEILTKNQNELDEKNNLQTEFKKLQEDAKKQSLLSAQSDQENKRLHEPIKRLQNDIQEITKERRDELKKTQDTSVQTLENKELLENCQEALSKLYFQNKAFAAEITQLRNAIDVVTKERDQLKDAQDKLILQAKKAGEDFSQQLRTIYGPVDKQYFVKI